MVRGMVAAMGLSVLVTSHDQMQRIELERKIVGYFWVPKGDEAPYLSVGRNSKMITHLCPTWWKIVDKEGTIEVERDPAVVAFARAEGIALLPLLANKDFDRAIIHSVLVSPTRRARVIDQIESLLKEGGYEGVNIDFENVPPRDRALMRAFMQELYARLHPQGLEVTIDVPAKQRDNPQAAWSGAFDYVALGKACDSLMVMAYDEHWSTGPPGPIASVGMVRQVLKYAISSVPREKIVLGVPFYGYDWPEKGRARGVTHTQAVELARLKNARVRWDEAAPSAWFRYRDGQGKPRTVWFETRRSLEAKLAVAQEMGIASISIWRLGDEDQAFWESVAAFREGKALLAEKQGADRSSAKLIRDGKNDLSEMSGGSRG